MAHSIYKHNLIEAQKKPKKTVNFSFGQILKDLISRFTSFLTRSPSYKVLGAKQTPAPDKINGGMDSKQAMKRGKERAIEKKGSNAVLTAYDAHKKAINHLNATNNMMGQENEVPSNNSNMTPNRKK